MKMLADIDKDTVDFAPNYDDRLKEPSVLPTRFPNLLVNGSSGIAVGMATNIPPHNMKEVVEGVNYLIDHPECDVPELMQYIKGPDFPTAGIIMGTKEFERPILQEEEKYIFVPVPKLLRIRATDLKLLLQSFLIRLKGRAYF